MLAGLLVAPLLLAAPPASAQVLTEGKKASFSDRANPKQDRARFRFRNDPALVSLISPICPAESEIRVVSSTGSAHSIALDCSRWEVRGSGLRYRGTRPTTDPTGVRSIRYGVGKLSVVVKGEGYALDPVSGPVDWLETTFRVGGQDHCGRWETLRRNEADRIVAQGPTSTCQVVCGDGDIDAPHETCDDGNRESGDGCSSSCEPEVCGDGFHTPPLEECDDGNQVDGDGCSATCRIETCGDGTLDEDEECDDGNHEDGDCCSAVCTAETGPCSDGSNCTQNDVCQAGACVGDAITPWINEIDYDNQSGGIVDREEFVEIAGPAGLDLGGYTLYGVEGADGSCQTPGPGLLSGPVLPGYVHWSVTMPPGTVLADDTGTGVGFLVVCNNPSSLTVINAGNCDIVFPGIASDSNFRNGELLNNPLVCPDGMLLVDPQGDYVDAVSYEGIVPAAGPLGAFFHVEPPYNAGTDEGWKPETSLEKWTNHLGRAVDGSEWRDSGGCSDQCVGGAVSYQCNWFTGLDPCPGFGATPGALNGGGQRYFCAELFCGDGVVTGDEECDEAELNSDAPDASCRTDCTLRRCGDGIVDPTAAPGFAETCEADSDCAAGEVCAGCQCATGTPLGDLSYTVVAGSAVNEPVDDGESTWFRINQPLPALLPIQTGSNGQWTAGPLQFTAGVPDASGVAPFYLAESVLISSPLPALAGAGRVCVRVRPDYDNRGFIDCDGGTNADVEIAVDSNFAGPTASSSLTVGANATNSGAGAAVAYVVLESASTADNTTPCEDAVFSEPIATAVTTATARSQIVNGLTVGNVAVQLTGQPFSCSSWAPDSGASIAWPTYNLDVQVPILGAQDVSQVLRLNDD